MNKTESVLKYYHRLFKLCQRAGTWLENRINMFIGSVSPDRLNSLQARKYNDFMKLLKDARWVEGYWKNVINNFYSNKDKTEKTSQRPACSLGAPRTTTQTTASKIIALDSKISHPNNNFNPMTKKPEVWVGIWYDGEKNLKKLTFEYRNKLVKQGRCWSCNGLGQR